MLDPAFMMHFKIEVKKNIIGANDGWLQLGLPMQTTTYSFFDVDRESMMYRSAEDREGGTILTIEFVLTNKCT